MRLEKFAPTMNSAQTKMLMQERERAIADKAKRDQEIADELARKVAEKTKDAAVSSNRRWRHRLTRAPLRFR